MNYFRKLLLIAGCIASVLVGCIFSSKTNTDDTGGNGSDDRTNVPVPASVHAYPGDATIELAWEAPELSGSLRYHVYRSMIESGVFDSLSTTAGTTYVDSDVTNETSYFYYLKLERDHIVGHPSDTLTATPYPYRVQLHDGRTIINRYTDVPISLDFRPGTTEVILRNENVDDPPIAVTVSPLDTVCTLSSGDGERIIYAKFRDADGNLTQEFSDSIMLDTSELDGPPDTP